MDRLDTDGIGISGPESTNPSTLSTFENTLFQAMLQSRNPLAGTGPLLHGRIRTNNKAANANVDALPLQLRGYGEKGR